MAITNHERVGKALELLKTGLGPFVEREFKNTYQERAPVEAVRLLGEDRLNAKRPIAEWDVAPLIKLMWESWHDVFRRTL
ncbi:MAG TPA: Swt1 family HEPN domain-containing protein, partial [Blastocatellia bacterium]|nr:Swt1 family HEPN domain-containing protein [Blastocatellia bacterium]